MAKDDRQINTYTIKYTYHYYLFLDQLFNIIKK